MPPAPPALGPWDDAKAAAARERFEARNARLERDEKARLEKLAQQIVTTMLGL